MGNERGSHLWPTFGLASPAADFSIPVYRPDLSGNERNYVIDCVETGWISSLGPYVSRFERSIATVAGLKHAVGVCNGTVALHLALHCLGIGPGDEVIVPTFTYIASVNTIAQTGAKPVFADCRAADWLSDPDDVQRRVTSRTRAILPVHLYGAACDMRAIQSIAAANGLRVVEDCAEALGTTIAGRHVGSFGDVGTFSFFGNKTVTTGEGGMVATDNDDLAAVMRVTKGQGQSLTRRYWHERLGFNYRLTNIAAAIGLAQMERLETILALKRKIAACYRQLLADLQVTFQELSPAVSSSEWLVSVLLPIGVDRDRLIGDMAQQGVETRPVFHCAHQMPMYAVGESFPIAEDISARGISLPSFPALTALEIDKVAQAVLRSLTMQGRH
jgi:perosamine synthetase